MNRRKFIAGAGGIGAATVGGMALMGSSAAEIGTDIGYKIGTVKLSSDDGTIDHVSMYGDSEMTWKGLDTVATQVQIDTRVKVFDNNDNKVADKQIHSTGAVALSQGSDWGNHDDELSGEGTRGYVKTGVGLDRGGSHDPSIDWAIIQASDYSDEYGLPTDPVAASHLSVSTDGDQQRFVVVIESTYTLFDSGGNELLSGKGASHINVDVTNIEESTTTGDGPENDGAVGGASNEGSLSG